MSGTQTLAGAWRRLCAAAAIALGLAAASPLAPALAEPPADPHGCPPGQFETPESCSGRPLLSQPARLALHVGPTALHDGHRGQPYAVNVVASVGGSPAQSAIEGHLPRGLSLQASGEIAGVPEEAGLFEFTVTLTDPMTQPTRTSQVYVLRIVDTRAAPPPRPGPRPGPRPIPRLLPVPIPVPPPTPVVSDQVPRAMVIYELSAADLDAVVKGMPPPPVVGAQAAAPAPSQVSVGVSAQAATPGAGATPQATPAGVGPAPAPAPAAAPAPARTTTRSPTAAQVAGVPGAAARAVGAPEPVARAAAAPAEVVKRVNAFAAAFKPLAPRKGRPASQPAPAPAAAPAAPLASSGVAVAEAAQAIPVPTTVAPVPQGLKTLPPDFATLVQPVLDVPYTSRDLFNAAVNSRVRLAPELLARVGDQARKVVPYTNASPLNWKATDGCRCNPLPHGPNDKVVYGFFPFWRSMPNGPQVNFRMFNRIGLLGAQLEPDGAWIHPSTPQQSADDWWDGLSRFAREAQAHGVQLDLVLEGRDWAYLASLDPETRRNTYEEAAHKAMLLIDTPMQGRVLRRLLLPMWNDPTHVFDGVTVMFDYPPANAPAAEQRAFKEYYDGFLRELVHQMEERGRPYALNIVAPDDLGEPQNAAVRARVWEDFLALKRLAETAKEHRDLPTSLSQLYVGRGRISVRLLTPLREPTTDAKKGIRAALDGIVDIKGLDRVEVQRSTVPILYLPEAPVVKGKFQARAMSGPESNQLSDDMVYLKQNFGGVAMWPMPVQGVEADGEVYHRLQQVYFDDHALQICSMIMRLLLEFLIVLLLVGGVYYAIWGSASGRRVIYMIVLGVIAGLAFADFVFLLFFDPALEWLKISNWPFVIVIAIVGVIALWSVLRPKVPKP